MPNQKGGKKFKKGKKQNHFQEKILLYRDPKEDQEYAKILKVNGSGRYNLFCFDGKDRLGICAGNIKRKVRIVVDDIVLQNGIFKIQNAVLFINMKMMKPKN